jgi:hypothetical protein
VSDPIIRANQWKLAYEGEGGIRDMFDSIRKAYFERAGNLDGLKIDEHAAALHKLALASRIVDMVDDHVRAIIDDGKIEQHNADYAERIKDLPERKKNWLKF